MFKRFSLILLLVTLANSYGQIQEEIRIPNTIYSLETEFNSLELDHNRQMELFNISFRFMDRIALKNNIMVIQMANIGSPAPSFDRDAYKQFDFDSYFFKGFDLYEVHSSQYMHWKSQERIKKQTAKALEKSYSQFQTL